MALVLNVTIVIPHESYLSREVYFVPRSVFFDSLLYQRLSTRNLVDPLGQLRFDQNATSASRNSDALQEIITGNVSEVQRNTILTLLYENLTGATTRVLVPLDWSTYTDDLFLFSLPDDALRLVGYIPPAASLSSTYRFCTTPNCQAPPTTLSIWDRIWSGIVTTVTSWIVSAVVIAVTAFQVFVQILQQVGSWIGGLISAAAQVVASAVQAAAKVVGQVVDAVANAILAVIHAALDPLINLVVAAYRAWTNEVAQLLMSIQSLSVDDFVRGLIQATFFSAFALAIFAIIVAFSVAEKITNAMTLGLANLAGIVIGVVAGLIIGMLAVAAINEWLGSSVIEDLLPPGFDDITGATFTVGQLLFAYELKQRALKPIQGVETALKDSILALMILGVSLGIKAAFGDSLQGLISLVIVDVIALYLALSGLKDMIKISGRGANLVMMWYPFLYPVTVAMNAIGIATAATDLVSDAGNLNHALAGG